MDSKICFIQPPYGFFMQSLDAPFTLMYLAAVAERCGWKASIVDMTTPEDSLPEADVYAVTSTSPQWKEAQKLSTRIATEHPDSLAIIGGVHVSAEPEAFMDSDFHIAVQGEGEEPLTVMLNDLREHPELMKEYCIMRRGLEVKGIPVEDLDTVPFPARHLVDWSRYKRGIYWGKQKIADAVSIISSRGCPHNCIDEDTRIVTEEGLIKIKDVQNEFSSIINTRSLKTPFGYCLAIMKKGEKPCVKLTLSNGIEFIATSDHKIQKVEDEKIKFAPISTLKEGDFIPISYGNNMWGVQSLDSDFAWLLGFLIGDGYIGISKGYKLLFGVKKYLLTKVTSILTKYSNNKLTIYQHPLTDKIIQVQLYDKKLYSYILSFGLDPKNKLKVPEAIFRCDGETVKSFLDGLWEADGTVDKRGYSYLTTISKKLALDVQQLLLNLGHNSVVYGPYGPYGQNTFGDNPNYRVYLDVAKNIVPINNRIYKSEKSGKYYFRTKEKNRRGVYRELLIKSGLPHKLLKKNVLYVQIKKAENAGNRIVYDMSINKTHRFVANGLIVHNCAFCGSWVIFGRKTRFRSVANVVEEIKQVKETMGYRGFNFHDDSVPAEETIPILENNVFKIVKIGDFIDNLLQEENIVEDERQIRYCMDLPIKVFSFNDKYDIEPTKIRRVIKHKTNKDVYQIVLASRRTVKVSRDHSVFMVKNGNIAPIAVSELEKGDWIVVPKRLSIPENMPIAIDTKQYKMVRKSRKSNSIKDSIMITEDLCWLLGMFVGDGCLSCDRRTITIFPSSIKLAEKCVTIFKDAIGLQGKIIDKTKSAWFCSTKAWQILRNGFQIILENGNRGSKRVPNLIYSLPIKYRKAFLKGYMEAEGHHNKNDDVYEISCNYKPLVNDIIYLLISIGENPKVYPTYHKQKDIHGYKIKIAINDIEQLGTGESYLRTRPYFSFHNKDLIVDNMEPTLKWHYKHKNLNPNGKTVIKSLAKKGLTEHNYDITADKIIEIKKIEPSGYLYDIEVEHDNGHDNFVGGFGGVCLHNTFALVPKRTLEMCKEFKNLDIFWRCLSRVDTITEELLDAMGGSGCREIVLGIESGSQKILNNLNKGVTVGQNLRALKLIKNHKGADGKRDIQVKAGIIVGSPGETWQTVKETEKLLRECPPDFWNVNVLSPFPGSPIWNSPEKYGIKILSRDPSQYSMVGKNYQGTVLVETEEMTKSDIEQARDELIELCLEISGPQYDL